MFSKDVPPYDFLELMELFRSKTLIMSSFTFGSIFFISLRDKSERFFYFHNNLLFLR